MVIAIVATAFAAVLSTGAGGPGTAQALSNVGTSLMALRGPGSLACCGPGRAAGRAGAGPWSGSARCPGGPARSAGVVPRVGPRRQVPFPSLRRPRLPRHGRRRGGSAPGPGGRQSGRQPGPQRARRPDDRRSLLLVSWIFVIEPLLTAAATRRWPWVRSPTRSATSSWSPSCSTSWPCCAARGRIRPARLIGAAWCCSASPTAGTPRHPERRRRLRRRARPRLVRGLRADPARGPPAGRRDRGDHRRRRHEGQQPFAILLPYAAVLLALLVSVVWHRAPGRRRLHRRTPGRP